MRADEGTMGEGDREPWRDRWIRAFQRVNYILIPKKRAERDVWRASKTARILRGIEQLSNRLSDDGKVVAMAIAFVAPFAIDIVHTQIYVLWVALVGVFQANSFLSPFFTLKDVSVDASVGPRVTLGEDGVFIVTLRNQGNRTVDAVLVRTAFAWSCRWRSRSVDLATLESGESKEVTFAGKFFERGEYILEPFRAHEQIPFGLVLGPAVRSGRLRFLVVPKIASVRTLDIARGRKQEAMGFPVAQRIADSRELRGVRPYRPGDPIRDLHARSWARLGQPVVREYQEEYFSRVAILLDTDVEHVPPGMFEAAISLVAGIVSNLQGSETLLDTLMLGKASHSFSRNQKALDRVLDLLALADAGDPFDGDAMMAVLLPSLPRLSSVILVSADAGPSRHAKFRDDLESRGTRVSTFVVARTRPQKDSAADTWHRPTGETFVLGDAIRAGRALSL